MSRRFPDFTEAFMQYADFTQCPKKFLRWSCYSIIAGALERKVWLSNSATIFYPNLYVMLIGGAGTRKSTSADFAIELLRYLPDVKFMANRINEASLFTGLMQVGEKKLFHFAEESFKHSACFLYASEAATSFAEMYQGSSIITALTDLFNCQPLGWHKNVGWSKLTQKDGWVNVFNPCLNLLACSTPAWFNSKIMSRTDAEAGFGSRLLLVVDKNSTRTTFGWAETTPVDSELRMRLVEDLREIGQLQGPFNTSSAFKNLYKKLDEELYEFQRADIMSSLMTGYYGRKLTHSVKLAMVIAVSQGNNMLLTDAHLQESWDLVSSLEEYMLSAYEAVGAISECALSEELMSYCESNNLVTFTKSSIVRKFKVKYQTKDIAGAIDALVKTGRIKYLTEGQGLLEPTFKLSVPSQGLLDS